MVKAPVLYCDKFLPFGSCLSRVPVDFVVLLFFYNVTSDCIAQCFRVGKAFNVNIIMH